MVSFQDSLPMSHCCRWVPDPSPGQSLWSRVRMWQWWLMPGIHALLQSPWIGHYQNTHYCCHVLKAVCQMLPNPIPHSLSFIIHSFRKHLLRSYHDEQKQTWSPFTAQKGNVPRGRHYHLHLTGEATEASWRFFSFRSFSYLQHYNCWVRNRSKPKISVSTTQGLTTPLVLNVPLWGIIYPRLIFVYLWPWPPIKRIISWQKDNLKI